MFDVPIKSKVKLIGNFSDRDFHSSEIVSRISKCVRIWIFSAFAKNSGYDLIKPELNRRLKKIKQITFVFGLDFFHTEPDLLRKLNKQVSKNTENTKLYISSRTRKYTFHPKIYAFQIGSKIELIIGSANLTSGGLEDNHEISLLIHDIDQTFGDNIDNYIEALVQEDEICQATKAQIDEYAELYMLRKIESDTSDRRLKRVIKARQRKSDPSEATVIGLEYIKSFTEEFKKDKSENGFSAKSKIRQSMRKDAIRILKELSEAKNFTESKFASVFRSLKQSWHSNILYLNDEKISNEYEFFLNGIRGIYEQHDQTEKNIYDNIWGKLKDINYVGMNVITEILHTLDNNRFPIMNRNSISGINLAFGKVIPSGLQPHMIKYEVFSKFSTKMNQLKQVLDLRDLSELDMVLNEIYFNNKGHKPTKP